MEKIFKNKNFTFQQNPIWRPKIKLLRFFQGRYFSRANFIVHMEKYSKNQNFTFQQNQKWRPKIKLLRFFQGRYFSRANFILHIKKNIQKIKISLFNKIQYGAKNEVGLIFSRKIFFDSLFDFTYGKNI